MNNPSVILRFKFLDYNISELSNANVAQLVEQLIRNQQVMGSIPFVGFFLLNINS